MPIDELTERVAKLAETWYKSGKSGISFGDSDPAEVAKALAKQGSRTSLIKDYQKLEKKVKELAESKTKSPKLSEEELQKREKKSRKVGQRVLSKLTRDKNGAIIDTETKNAAGEIVRLKSESSTTGEPDSISQVVNKYGGINRDYYGSDGNQTVQISNNGHGNPSDTAFGEFGEHAHDYYVGEDGNMMRGEARDLTPEERKRDGDML